MRALPDQALRVLDNAMDTIIDAPEAGHTGWALLQRDASGGMAMRAFAHVVYGLRKARTLGIFHAFANLHVQHLL
jgi:hypothetical protein